MASLRQHETIVPLIQVSRKLQAVSAEQLSMWMSKIIKAFETHGQQRLLSKILLQGLASCHQSISAAVWKEIQCTAPKEDSKLIIDDSISKSVLITELKEEKNPTLTLLNMPHVLQCLCCTFLRLFEVDAVQETCRCLAIVARDPNALFQVETTFTMHRSRIHYFEHPRFSRIQSLILRENESRREQKFFICI